MTSRTFRTFDRILDTTMVVMITHRAFQLLEGPQYTFWSCLPFVAAAAWVYLGIASKLDIIIAQGEHR